MRGRGLACLGAFITLATLAVDFSIQSLVSYPARPLEVGNAYLPRTMTYSNFAGELGSSPHIDQGMLGAINTGIFDFGDSHNVSPICTTGNCTWPRYTSIGVCSQCFDVTTQVDKSCQTSTTNASDADTFNPNLERPCTYILPNGLNISESGPGNAFVMSPNTSNSINFVDQNGWAYLSILSAMNATWTVDGTDQLSYVISDVNATECGVWLCERTYNGSVTNNTFSEQVVDTGTDVELGQQTGFNVFDYQAIGTAFEGSGSDIAGIWTGYARVGNFFSELIIPSGPYASFLYSLDFDGLSKMMSSLAASMTTHIRKTGNVAEARVPAVGTMWQDVAFVQVQWAWITLPAALVALALCFLVVTAVVNSRQGTKLWKGSSIAASYHPLSTDGRHVLKEAAHPRRVHRVAEDLNVRWTEKECFTTI
ncbi:hypothetical protein PV11_08747 [Exophiala sideris]|uniref:Peptidase A1 domain-containing protein n=1 Tax=Exophiala sideris TaxID=1016849 RepID=A0A0D1Y1T7_9EURO|nr:hypothetical protein PV11_08747 [Exophiala sideris]